MNSSPLPPALTHPQDLSVFVQLCIDYSGIDASACSVGAELIIADDLSASVGVFFLGPCDVLMSAR